jgi:hypothetical protein
VDRGYYLFGCSTSTTSSSVPCGHSMSILLITTTNSLSVTWRTLPSFQRHCQEGDLSMFTVSSSTSDDGSKQRGSLRDCNTLAPLHFKRQTARYGPCSPSASMNSNRLETLIHAILNGDLAHVLVNYGPTSISKDASVSRWKLMRVPKAGISKRLVDLVACREEYPEELMKALLQPD